MVDKVVLLNVKGTYHNNVVKVIFETTKARDFLNVHRMKTQVLQRSFRHDNFCRCVYV